MEPELASRQPDGLPDRVKRIGGLQYVDAVETAPVPLITDVGSGRNPDQSIATRALVHASPRPRLVNGTRPEPPMSKQVVSKTPRAVREGKT